MKRLPYLISLLMVLAAVGCRREEATSQRGRIEVKVAAATEGELPEVMTFVGTLRATRRASVSSAQSGTVIRVAVRDGDSVSAGQPLIWLETREMEAKLREQEAAVEGARAHVAELEASVRSAEDKLTNGIKQAQQDLAQAQISIHSIETQLAANKRNFDRLQTLYKEKAVARSQLDSAELQYKLSQDQLRTALSKKAAAESSLRLSRQGLHDVDVQRAQLQGARASVSQAEASANSLRVQMQQSVLHAPIAGTVVQRNVEPGQAVGGGGALLTVVDNAQLECVTSVEERFAGRLRPGMVANLQTAIATDRKMTATLVDVIPSSDPKTSTLRARLRIQNRDRVLMDGLSINGRITLREHKGVLLPREAVHTDGKARYVHVVQSEVATKRPVEIEFQDHTLALVKGVRAGEFVVVDGVGLTDNQPVKIEYTPPPEPPSTRPSAR